MAEYDLIIKALAERYMHQLASFVRGTSVAVGQVVDKDKETVAVQRTSDILFKVQEEGYEYLMLVEFQTRPDRKMARRLLEYMAIHHRRYKMPVYPVVFNLTGGGKQSTQYTHVGDGSWCELDSNPSQNRACATNAHGSSLHHLHQVAFSST